MKARPMPVLPDVGSTRVVCGNRGWGGQGVWTVSQWASCWPRNAMLSKVVAVQSGAGEGEG